MDTRTVKRWSSRQRLYNGGLRWNHGASSAVAPVGPPALLKGSKRKFTSICASLSITAEPESKQALD